MSAENKLKELRIQLGPVTPPVANYVNAVQTGNLLFLAGKGPAGGAAGVVGREVTGPSSIPISFSFFSALIAAVPPSLGS